MTFSVLVLRIRLVAAAIIQFSYTGNLESHHLLLWSFTGKTSVRTKASGGALGNLKLEVWV
jgi:hypothetical protein